MNWLISALNSSVGKKLLMALTGFLVCGFLVVHLAGNVLMYVGPNAYNTYAHTLHSQEWAIKIAEVGLLAIFLTHIALAMLTTKENRTARPQGYGMRRSKIKDRKVPFGISPENYMLTSGVIIVFFVLIHLGDFTFNLTMPEKLEGREPFDKAIIIMRSPISFWSYILGVALMSWHLAHGVTSMFQTLGLRHKKYDPFTQSIGPIFAWVMAIGFISFPIFANVTDYDPYAAAPAADHGHSDEQGKSDDSIVKPVPEVRVGELPASAPLDEEQR